MSKPLMYMHTVFICLLFMLYVDVTLATARVPVATKTSGDHASVIKPLKDHQRQVFGETEVKSCMPKGFRHSSAPSRYANYHTMTSSACSTTVTIRGTKNSRTP
ncbi:hypothetical protein NMG60_11033220 [Bertholletia excelsa]